MPGKVKCPVGHRYFQDDIPYGLCVFRTLADLFGVETPQIDELIMWGQRIMDKQYLVDGKLKGKDVTDIPIWGYSIEELISG